MMNVSFSALDRSQKGYHVRYRELLAQVNCLRLPPMSSVVRHFQPVHSTPRFRSLLPSRLSQFFHFFMDNAKDSKGEFQTKSGSLGMYLSLWPPQ